MPTVERETLKHSEKSIRDYLFTVEFRNDFSKRETKSLSNTKELVDLATVKLSIYSKLFIRNMKKKKGMTPRSLLEYAEPAKNQYSVYIKNSHNHM